MSDALAPVLSDLSIDQAALGAYFRKVRDERGWSRWHVAVATQVRESTIFRVESGGGLPGVDLFLRLLEVYGLELGDVLTAEGVVVRG